MTPSRSAASGHVGVYVGRAFAQLQIHFEYHGAVTHALFFTSLAYYHFVGHVEYLRI